MFNTYCLITDHSIETNWKNKAKYIRIYKGEIPDLKEKFKFSFLELFDFLFELPNDFYMKNITPAKVANIETCAIFQKNSEKEEKLFLLEINTKEKSATIKYVNEPTHPILFSNNRMCPYPIYYIKSEDTLNKQFTNTLTHPFCKLGKRYLKAKLIDYKSTVVIIQQFAFAPGHIPQSQKVVDFNQKEFWEEYGGFVKINFSNDMEYGVKMDADSRLHSILYINPDYKSIIDAADFFEMDASFFALRPYVYWIPLLIIKNESFPIGLSVGPSETKELYNQFFTFLDEKDPDAFEKMRKLPALADEGSAIFAAANEHHIDLYKCFRHLIQKFGAASEIGEIVKILLFSSSEEIFKANYNEYKEDIKRICNDPKHSSTKSKFEDLFNYSLNDEPTLGKQAIWERTKKHISTCSNHIESIHKVANEATKNCRCFRTQLKTLLEILVERSKTARTRPNFQREINESAKFIRIHNYNVEKFIEHNPMKVGLYREEFCDLLSKKVQNPKAKISEIRPIMFEKMSIPLCFEVCPTQFTNWVMTDPKKIQFKASEFDQLYAENNGGIERDRIITLFNIEQLESFFPDETKVSLFIHFHRLTQHRLIYEPSPDFNRYIRRVIKFGIRVADFQLLNRSQIKMEDEDGTGIYLL